MREECAVKRWCEERMRRKEEIGGNGRMKLTLRAEMNR
jgi:hypothetical protein